MLEVSAEEEINLEKDEPVQQTCQPLKHLGNLQFSWVKI